MYHKEKGRTYTFQVKTFYLNFQTEELRKTGYHSTVELPVPN